MKKALYTLIFLFLVFFVAIVQGTRAQISQDTVNGWYIINTTGSVNVAYSRLVKDTAYEGSYSQSFYHETTLHDYGEVWYEKKLGISRETRRFFVISAQITYIEPRIHSNDGVTFVLLFGNADSMRVANGGVLGTFDLFYWHEFWFESPNPPSTFDRVRLVMFNTSNRSEILFDEFYVSDGYSKILIDCFGDPLTSVEDENLQMPEKFSLFQNYPNPFNSFTAIHFNLLTYEANGRLSVFDVLGREVAILVEGEFPAGEHKITFTPDATLPSGMYLYRLTTSRYSETRKMLLLK